MHNILTYAAATKAVNKTEATWFGLVGAGAAAAADVFHAEWPLVESKRELFSRIAKRGLP